MSKIPNPPRQNPPEDSPEFYPSDPEEAGFEYGQYDDPTALAEPTPPPRRNYTSYYPPAPPPTAVSPRVKAGKAAPQPKPSTKRRPPRPEPVDRRQSGLYLPWWSLVVMLVAVGGLSFGSLMVVGSLGGQSLPGGATPLIVVITSTFTVGPPASPSPLPVRATLTPTKPLPTIAPTASLPAGEVKIGSVIQVVGVGGSGLNIRSGPGRQFNAKFLAQDGQQYTVKDGPQIASDEEWWLIQDLNNPNLNGWASRRFLTVLR